MWRNALLSGLVLASVLLAYADGTSDKVLKERERKGKLFPIFQIVRFENDQCDGGSKNGTCYTADECEDRGGTNSGSCASGYGVCCTFDINCGASSNENCTYFESDSPTSGGCSAQICPCNNNICQLRLDFETFVITGPSTDISSVLKISGGTLDTAAGLSATVATQCLTDTFVVTNAAGRSSDVLCGTNTGQHLYVETNDGCTDLNFQLGQGAVGTTVASRQWQVKVTQYGCESPVRAPAGCDQYYYGAASAAVETFNYNNGNGVHLANQEQTICVRRERGNCRICWYANDLTDVQLSNDVTSMAAPMSGFNTGSKCCDYGADGLGVEGYDCVMIPGAQNTALNGRLNSNICGRNAGLVSAMGTSAAAGSGVSICSERVPFYIRFLSDSYEFLNEATNQDTGFSLTYTQDSTNC